MIVDAFEEVLKHTSLIPLPTASPTGVTPIPPVHSDSPELQFIGDSGKKTLWVVFVLMLIASASFTALSWRVPLVSDSSSSHNCLLTTSQSKRLYHTITTSITIFAALSYFAMATGHGISVQTTIVREQHDHVPDTFTEVHRQVFWARYVDWSLTTPLLILDLGLLAGMSGGHIIMAIIADLIMILTGLFAAFGEEGTPQKWGWYTIACIAYLFVIWHLALNGGANATAKGTKLRAFFVSIGIYTLILWTAYPM
jgi:bacteriorhodopsin